MSVPGIGVYYSAHLASGFMHFLLLMNSSVGEIIVLMKICLRLCCVFNVWYGRGTHS